MALWRYLQLRITKLCLVGTLCSFTAQQAAAKNASGTANSKRDHYNTYPQPPRVKPRDKMLVAPGYALPPSHQLYVWKTTGKNPQGKTKYTDNVPVFYIDPYRRYQIGEVPIGTEVKLDTVTHFRGVMHFRIPYKSALLDKIARVGWRGYAWVSGEFVEATDYKPGG